MYIILLYDFLSFYFFCLFRGFLVHFCCRFVARFGFLLLLLWRESTLETLLKAYKKNTKQVDRTWEDIKTTGAGRMLYLPSMQKTKQPAIVPPSEKALEWLPEHPADCKADTKVFANAPTLSSANRALKHMARRADIRKTISFHVARHTFATMTLTAGGDLYTTSRLLGHTNHPQHRNLCRRGDGAAHSSREPPQRHLLISQRSVCCASRLEILHIGHFFP